MNLSDNGINLLKTLEGFRAKPYADTGGEMTVGYGHLIVPGDGVAKGDIIDPVKATELLHKDVFSAEKCVTNSVLVPLEQHQFDALVIFTYNIGNTAFMQSTALKVLNMGGINTVPDQIMRWDRVNGKPSLGLHNRRLREATLFSTGVYDARQT